MESGRIFFNPSSHADMLFLGKADPPFLGASWSMMKMEESFKRRPLLGCPEYAFDEEYYDDQSLDKKRRLTSEQIHLLEKSFEEENKLEPERKMELANNLGLRPRQVAVWFQNRRARWKTKQLERDYDQLKSSHDSLLSHYNTLLKENEKLKAEVGLLTKKLQAKEVGGDHAPSYPKSDPLQVLSEKVEDCPSSGCSGGSAVVNEESPQLLGLDYCGNSYFHTEDMDHACLPPPPLTETTAQSEEPLGWFWS